MRITLLTDFGSADGYVAAMKGAIAEIAPSALIDDASHDIAPGNIMAGAFALRRYWRMYPEGTVHVVVIDPGVGSVRRALLVEADGRFLVGPDNGVFTFALRDAARTRCFEITNQAVLRKTISHTFHGRDIFASVAGHIAMGEAIETVGSAIANPVLINLPPAIATASSVRGEVVHIDRFGNLITNISRDLLQPGQVVRLVEREARIVDTYGTAAPGELVALINSDRLLEIAVRDGSAAAALNVVCGVAVELHS